MKERVLVAMSGGVDSSVAAARLVKQGYEVIGVTLHLWDYPDDGSVKSRCCAPEDIYDARAVADRLGIPHYTFDRRHKFRSAVVDPFVNAYVSGSTPSPCVSCNRQVKFAELLLLAEDLDAQWLATGHYARVDRDRAPPHLLRGVDRRKDQSYFLHMLGKEVLERLLLPLGNSTKDEVRAEALALGLPGASKGESQELCFIPSGRYSEFVAQQAPDRIRPGPIVGPAGLPLGTHGGVHQFTIGQRKNLGVAVGERAYVVSLSANDGTVQLGPAQALQAGGAIVGDLTLADDVQLPIRCEVSVRYQASAVPAFLREQSGEHLIEFCEPQRAVVPGQVAVLYQGERAIGGGPILRAVAPPLHSLHETAPGAVAPGASHPRAPA